MCFYWAPNNTFYLLLMSFSNFDFLLFIKGQKVWFICSYVAVFKRALLPSIVFVSYKGSLIEKYDLKPQLN